MGEHVWPAVEVSWATSITTTIVEVVGRANAYFRKKLHVIEEDVPSVYEQGSRVFAYDGEWPIMVVKVSVDLADDIEYGSGSQTAYVQEHDEAVEENVDDDVVVGSAEEFREQPGDELAGELE